MEKKPILRHQDQLMIRLILTNPELQKEDLDYFFHKLINMGQAIANSRSS